MLEYFRPIRYDDYTLSIDNVVIDYHFHPRGRELLAKMLETITFEYCCELVHWDSLKIGTFKMQFTIQLYDGNSFWLGMGLNQGKTNYGRIRIEFNPNKVANHDCFRKVLAFLNTCCSPMHTTVRRFDLALDYPVLRENASLVKDSRKYSEVRTSLSDRTQYLGTGQNHGRVKLYNKQLENGLHYPLTRLELTLDPEQSYEDINFPTVYFVQDMQMTFADMDLNETDRFILGALLQGYGELSQLGRKTREKMKRVMSDYVTYFSLPRERYEAILAQLKDFKEYPSKKLDERNLDMDYLEPYKGINWGDFEDIEDDEEAPL